MSEDAMVDFLKRAVHKRVQVLLGNGTQLLGIFHTIDNVLDVVLGDVEEIPESGPPEHHKSMFIRGRNVIHVAILPE